MSPVRSRLPHPVEPSAPEGLPTDLPTDPPSRPHADSARVEAAELFLVWDLVDEWGAQSFPASDPPANW
jgi:hypothetical protein